MQSELGEHSRLGCGSARPRAEHGRTSRHQTVWRGCAFKQAARARPAAPEAGALPSATASFRLRDASVALRLLNIEVD